MIKTNFNDNWRVSVNHADVFATTSPEEKLVTLPYDAMVYTPRNSSESTKKAFYENGAWKFNKTVFIPKENRSKRTIFEFEGAYQRAMVYINGDFAGQQPYGYSPFLIDADRFLRYGEDNEITVTVRTADDSRWYTGAGIYRDVYMLTSSLVYVKPYGVKITTPDIDAERAVVCIATTLRNDGAESLVTASVTIEIKDADGQVVASCTIPCSVFRGEESVLRQRLYIDNPQLWGVESPNLYVCNVYVKDSEGLLLDESKERFGIRSLSLDLSNGLRINGKTVKLRGACIHHDNGPLGAASFADAERRRVLLLKESGFNSIRMSHHPASPALLKACDDLGLLVMDEAFDMWTINKSDFDYALDFPTWWEHDIHAMINKDFNHPCVIMYSIGNEIKEIGTPNGTAWARKLAEKIRELDSTRYITNGVNGMLAVMDSLAKMHKNAEIDMSSSQGEINNMMTGMGEMMKRVMCSEMVTKATEESFACLDIAGYNYMDNRYLMDKDLFPQRLIIGSETFPSDIDRNWRMVLDNGNILGDFTWTGWDYLGEVGIGKVKYPEGGKFENVYNSYPTLTAMAGDIAITGFRRPVSYYREIVFGKRTKPFIAAQRPQHYHDIPMLPPWCWSDSASHWNWVGFEGKPIKVEVYSQADEVELVINGKSVGRKPAGESNRFKATFDTVYEPGEIKALAYNENVVTEQFQLRTATGDMVLSVNADRKQIDKSGLAFVDISLTDTMGNLYATNNKKVRVDVDGAGQMIGLANADPDTEENFYDIERTTYDGHLIAVIRPTDEGIINVTVSAEGLAPQSVQVTSI